MLLKNPETTNNGLCLTKENNLTMDKGIFLTVKDLMRLTGSDNEASAGRMHRTIRDSIAQDKRKLTIKEYCQYERLDFKEIWIFLREGKYVNQ